MLIYLVYVFLNVSYLYHLMFFLIQCDMMVANIVNSHKADLDILDLVPHHATLEGWTWTWRSLAGTFVLGFNKRLQHY